MTTLPSRLDSLALNRSFLGFDSLFRELEAKLTDQINTTYPPFNVKKYDDDVYDLEIAVTGFSPSDIDVTISDRHLTVTGHRAESDDGQYVYRGLASRNFTRKWALSEHMQIVDEGYIKHGVLTIRLRRVVPEELKPRKLNITAG